MPFRALKRAYNFAMSEEGSIKTRVLRSGLWVGLGEVVVNFISFFKSVALARLLSPDMFGLMGLCNMVLNMVETFTRPGIAQALIQRKSSFEEARDTAFTLLVGRGGLLAAILILMAPLAAWFYESHELEPMLTVLSVVFLITGLQNINTIARQKELEFRKLTYISQASAIVGSVITVSAAFWLRNVWALVIGQIATSMVSVGSSYYFVRGRPRFSFDWRIARELLSYGKFITASSIVLFVAMNLDTAVIGKLLGTEELGYYVLAITLANLITTSLSKLASGIMMPAYSKLQLDKPALRSAYLRTVQFVSLATFPATVGALVTAEFVIHVVYGEKWSGAVLPFQILVIFGLMRSLASINGYLFEGIGRPQMPFYVGVLRLIALGALIIPMTIKFGLPGTAVSVAATMGLQWLVFLVLASRELTISVRLITSTLWDPVWKSILMGAVVTALTLYVDGMTKSGLAIIVVSGVAIYLLLNAKMILKIKRHGLA